MASTQTASRLWKSHPTESTVSQAGRQATLFLTPLSPFPLCCIYLSVCLYLLSPPAWCLGVIHLKYLSCPSKNDLRGRGKSIFSQSGHGQAILGTRGISHYCTLPRSLSLQPTVLWRIAQFVTSWLTQSVTLKGFCLVEPQISINVEISYIGRISCEWVSVSWGVCKNRNQ